MAKTKRQLTFEQTVELSDGIINATGTYMDNVRPIAKSGNHGVPWFKRIAGRYQTETTKEVEATKVKERKQTRMFKRWKVTKVTYTRCLAEVGLQIVQGSLDMRNLDKLEIEPIPEDVKKDKAEKRTDALAKEKAKTKHAQEQAKVSREAQQVLQKDNKKLEEQLNLAEQAYASQEDKWQEGQATLETLVNQLKDAKNQVADLQNENILLKKQVKELEKELAKYKKQAQPAGRGRSRKAS